MICADRRRFSNKDVRDSSRDTDLVISIIIIVVAIMITNDINNKRKSALFGAMWRCGRLRVACGNWLTGGGGGVYTIIIIIIGATTTRWRAITNFRRYRPVTHQERIPWRFERAASEYCLCELLILSTDLPNVVYSVMSSFQTGKKKIKPYLHKDKTQIWINQTITDQIISLHRLKLHLFTTPIYDMCT